MKAPRIISTLLAAAAVAGGISVAVAQNAVPPTPAQDTGTKKDIEATGAMRSEPPMAQSRTAANSSSSSSGSAPAPSAAGSSMTDNSANNSAGSEPAPQADRG